MLGTALARFKGIHLSAIPFRGAPSFVSLVDPILLSLSACFSQGFPCLGRSEIFEILIAEFGTDSASQLLLSHVGFG